MSDPLSSLPVEIIHRILDEISTCDILSHVCLVNQRLHSICLRYHRFRFDLTCSFNTTRQHFDNKCTQLLRFSSQVVSLTLANDGDATISIRIAHFFSRLTSPHLNFSNLRSLILSRVDVGVWESFKVRRSSFLALTSMSISFDGDDECLTPPFVSNAVNDLLLLSSSLLHLTVKAYNYPSDRVTLAASPMLTTSSITHLTLDNIEIDLPTLLSVAPRLRSFNSTADCSHILHNIHPLPPVHLQRLSIDVKEMPLAKIERLLSSMKQLAHFTLVAHSVDEEWAEGDKWTRLLASIKTFQFMFTFHFDAFREKPFHLPSFQTNFWLLEKKWYVTFDSCLLGNYSLLYSNPYFLEWYPFYDMVGTLLTESTNPEPTSFPRVKEFDAVNWLSLSDTLRRRCTHLNELSISSASLQCSFNWRAHLSTLHTSNITSVSLDTIAMTSSINATIELLNKLPSVRSLRVSVSLLKMLLGYHWPRINRLQIVWGSDRLPKFFDENQVNSLCRSFTHIHHLEFNRSFIDNVAQLLNDMIRTLSHVYILHLPPITTHDDRFISHQWLEHHTKLHDFHYSVDGYNTVHLWL